MSRSFPFLRSAAVGLLFLALLELCLRGFGLFDPTELHDPYLGFPGTAPLYRVEADAQGVAVRRTSPNKRRSYRDVSFPAVKPPGELRVFCIGGSSLQLERFSSPAAAFPDFLELYLRAAAPERAPRVVNAGGGATGSVQNLEVLREVLEYEPDLLVVYPEGGEKNLIPPAPGAALALRDEQAPERVVARRALAQLRVYAAARESLTALQPAESGSWLRSAFSAIAGYAYARPFDEQTFAGLFELKRDSAPVLMPHVIPAAEVERGHARFRRNLQAMADLAAARDVPLVFVVPQRNAESSFYLRFHIDPSEIRPGQVETWRQAYELGLAAKRAARTTEAVRLLEQVRATYVEDRDDLLAFHLAECHAALGDGQAALREYALSIRRHPLIGILREVARGRRVPLIDPFEALVAEAGGGVPGHELFVDSVHPYPAACRAIARSILEGLVAQQVLSDVRAPDPERLAEVEARCAELVRESTIRNTPIHARIYRAIRRGDLDQAVRWGESRPRAELLLDPVDLFYYGWALTLAGRLDEARALYDESRALYVGADTRLPDLSTREAMIEIAFSGDVFAFF
jgi:tetratricopeptide (TPR) repeat protein